MRKPKFKPPYPCPCGATSPEDHKEEYAGTHFNPNELTSLEIQDAGTLAAYWLTATDKQRKEMWSSDFKKICEVAHHCALTASSKVDIEELKSIKSGLIEALKMAQAEIQNLKEEIRVLKVRLSNFTDKKL